MAQWPFGSRLSSVFVANDTQNSFIQVDKLNVHGLRIWIDCSFPSAYFCFGLKRRKNDTISHICCSCNIHVFLNCLTNFEQFIHFPDFHCVIFIIWRCCSFPICDRSSQLYFRRRSRINAAKKASIQHVRFFGDTSAECLVGQRLWQKLWEQKATKACTKFSQEVNVI